MRPTAAVVGLMLELAASLEPILAPAGVYAGGSLGTGDYVPGISDLDFVAIVASPLSGPQREAVGRMHRRLRREPEAAKLHCHYVVAGQLGDLEAAHLMWDGQRFRPRKFTGVARAELLRSGLMIAGAPPATLIPPVSDSQLRTAVLGELTGYWTAATQWRTLWWRDGFVDLGLLTLPRASAVLTSGELITKTRAIEGLEEFSVPGRLIEEVSHRRSGEPVSVTLPHRARRAGAARDLVAAGVRQLLAER